MEIKGRCLSSGLPKVFRISSVEMLHAFEEVTTQILEKINSVLERTPPELVSDISKNGIIMTGGGSLLWGFDQLVTAYTGIQTRLAEDAVTCVINGTGKSLEQISQIHDKTISRRTS